MAAYAPITYKKSEASSIFDIPFDYLSQRFITVQLEGVLQTFGVDYDFLDKTRIRFLKGDIPAGKAVTLERHTDPSQRLVSWKDASVLRANDLELFQLQLLHIAEEAAVVSNGSMRVDFDSRWNALGLGIKNLADPIQDQDAVTKKWSRMFFGDLLSAIQGPINNATNIFYRAPDLLPHVIQDLSGADGAELIGDGSGTVRDTTDALARQAQQLQHGIDTVSSSIDSLGLSVESEIFGKNVILPRVRSRISSGAPFMHVLGDSISHGAFADDWYRNGWVNLFKRMLNVELGTYSYGVTPLLPFANPETGAVNSDIHDVLIGANWILYDTLLDVPTGASYVTATAGAQIDITVPTFQEVATIYYAQNPSGGGFDILINDTLLTTINTYAATRNPFAGYGFVLKDNGLGSCKITIRASSAAEITGIGYYQAANQAVLQNMSQSGRKLRNTSQICVQKLMAESALFVMALGVNDFYDHQNDDTKYKEFTQVIDWLIQYANQYEVPVVVPDFIWYVGPENRTRAQLRRLATQTKGVYIPFPDFFMKNGIVPNSAYLIETLNLFSNDLHPNVAGHKLIAETIAKKLGLSVSSKTQVLDYHDWWFPLALNPASGVTNKALNAPLTSAIKNQGSQILVRLNLSGLSGAMTKGVTLGFPSKADIRFNLPVTTQLTPTSAGVSQGVCIFNSAGVSFVTNTQNMQDDHQLFFSVARTMTIDT
ncbi:phage tail fiber protein [Pseudomonas sp. W2Jun17]|uniref:phage tail fiber domain-containing protein n=1 Tax=Pseudomonas sp. W2Jun17 TaxID=1553460 RepID=UPI002004F7F5|nr:phage tail fiber protein [Pseudomonas sp. W2Jun17]MCK3850621.1 hypothetical protein [Pseudomonas sp. W2Jun17]